MVREESCADEVAGMEPAAIVRQAIAPSSNAGRICEVAVFMRRTRSIARTRDPLPDSSLGPYNSVKERHSDEGVGAAVGARQGRVAGHRLEIFQVPLAIAVQASEKANFLACLRLANCSSPVSKVPL